MESPWRRLNMHRDHRWAQPRLSEYVDGALDQRQTRRLAVHEEICPDCGRLIRTLRTTLATLGSLGSRSSDPVGEVAVERALTGAIKRAGR